MYKDNQTQGENSLFLIVFFFIQIRQIYIVFVFGLFFLLFFYTDELYFINRYMITEQSFYAFLNIFLLVNKFISYHTGLASFAIKFNYM